MTFAFSLLGIPAINEHWTVLTSPSAVHDKDDAEGNWISLGNVIKRMSLSIILIDGVKDNVTIDVPPFWGFYEVAPTNKKDGTLSIPTDRPVLFISVLSIAHPVRSWMSILKFPELAFVLGLRMFSHVINIGPFDPI